MPQTVLLLLISLVYPCNIIACKLILLVVKLTIDAIRRKYEAVRRQWKSEGKEGHAEMVELEGMKKKKRQRLRRVYLIIQYLWHYIIVLGHSQKFDNRKSVVWDTEVQYWEVLSLDYMTEESDDELDPNHIVEHKLPWRSNGQFDVCVDQLCITLMYSVHNLLQF